MKKKEVEEQAKQILVSHGLYSVPDRPGGVSKQGRN